MKAPAPDSVEVQAPDFKKIATVDFLFALARGDAKKMASALARGANPNPPGRERPTLVELVEGSFFTPGREKCLRLLLPLCDPLARGPKGETALMCAAARPSRLKMMKALIPVSDPLARDEMGVDALMQASSAGSLPGVKALLPVSDPLALDNSRMSALMLCVAYCPSASALGVIKALAPASDFSLVSRSGKSALHLAALRGNPAILGAILRHTDLDMRMPSGVSALKEALAQTLKPVAMPDGGFQEGSRGEVIQMLTSLVEQRELREAAGPKREAKKAPIKSI